MSPPFLRRHLCPSEEVEGQLPEQSVRGILDQPGEPGPMSMMMKMADAEILFHKVRLVVFDRPVGIKIAGELHRLSRFVQASLRRFSFDLFFFQLVFVDATAGRFYQAGIDGNAFIDG